MSGPSSKAEVRPFDRDNDRERPPLKRPRLKVDREKTCPLLLRVFTKINNGHWKADDFNFRGREEPTDEIQIYTWRDATLREITDLLKEVIPAAQLRTARLNFSFIYPDNRGRPVLKEIGVTHSGKKGEDDYKALDDLNFEIGDYLAVAIFKE